MMTPSTLHLFRTTNVNSVRRQVSEDIDTTIRVHAVFPVFHHWICRLITHKFSGRPNSPPRVMYATVVRMCRPVCRPVLGFHSCSISSSPSWKLRSLTRSSYRLLPARMALNCRGQVFRSCRCISDNTTKVNPRQGRRGVGE